MSLLHPARTVAFLCVSLVTSCRTKEQSQTATPQVSVPEWENFTATAYSAKGETASGQTPREGRTAAADPSVFPPGTQIEVADAGPYSGTYVINDTGPKIRGREIDLYIEQPAEAKRFGKKQVRVRRLDAAKP